MKLDNISMIDVVPPFMQTDSTVRGLCAAGDVILNRLIEALNKTDFVKNLNLLDEDTLDYIASANQIPWYSTADSREAKINTIKNSERVFWGLGTVFAVEQVVTDVIGSGTVLEWFNYSGSQHHFRLQTQNVINESKVARAVQLTGYAKKAQSVMDSIDKVNQTNRGTYYGYGQFMTKHLKIVPVESEE